MAWYKTNTENSESTKGRREKVIVVERAKKKGGSKALGFSFSLYLHSIFPPYLKNHLPSESLPAPAPSGPRVSVFTFGEDRTGRRGQSCIPLFKGLLFTIISTVPLRSLFQSRVFQTEALYESCPHTFAVVITPPPGSGR